MPLRVGLLGAHGEDLPVRPAGASPLASAGVLELREPLERFRFEADDLEFFAIERNDKQSIDFAARTLTLKDPGPTGSSAFPDNRSPPLRCEVFTDERSTKDVTARIETGDPVGSYLNSPHRAQ